MGPPPPHDDPSNVPHPPQDPNPFEAPNSEHGAAPPADPPRDAAFADPNAPRPVKFAAFLGGVCTMAAEHPELFLSCAGVFAVQQAFFVVFGGLVVAPVSASAAPAAYAAVLAGYVVAQLLTVSWLLHGLAALWLEVGAGRRTRLRKVFGGLRTVAPALGILLLSMAAMFVGLLLCVVPAFLAAALTAAALPALAAERQGVFASLRRAYALARPSVLPVAAALLCLYAATLAANTAAHYAARTLEPPIREAFLAFPNALVVVVFNIACVQVYLLALEPAQAARAAASEDEPPAAASPSGGEGN